MKTTLSLCKVYTATFLTCLPFFLPPPSLRPSLPLSLSPFPTFFLPFETQCVSCYSIDLSDPQLRTLVKSPVKIDLGGRGILKVNKSQGGSLSWFHNGRPIEVSQDSHYTFVDTKGSSGTQLEISDARAKQAGLYEVVLMKDGCEVRNIIDVQLQGKYRQNIAS